MPACIHHKSIPDHAARHDVVHDENKRKNRAIGRVMELLKERAPDPIPWSYDDDRQLFIHLSEDVDFGQKQSVQGVLRSTIHQKITVT